MAAKPCSHNEGPPVVGGSRSLPQPRGNAVVLLICTPMSMESQHREGQEESILPVLLPSVARAISVY